MPQLSLTLLGAFRVRRDGIGEVSITARKTRALLAFLALPAGRLHERDRLAELLWGDSDDARARHSLRQALSLLRRALPDALILGDRIGLAAEAVAVDAMAFDRLAGGDDAASLDGAMQLYAGDLLDGFQPPSEPFADWHRGERERLRERALQALDQRLAQLHRGGAMAPAIATALRLLELDPLREPAHRVLMRLYQQQGRAAAALQQYQRLIELLRRELGTEPEDETRQLYEQLLLRTRQRVAQPPAAAASEMDGAARTDPPLLGRDAELVKLDALGAAARGGRGRAVAVLGEAGAGKTRMLGELAERWRDTGGRVLRGSCREIQARVPLHLWTTTLSGLSGIEQDRVLGNGTPARRQIAALLGDGGGDADGPSTATAANRHALFAAVTDLAARLAAERPLLLCLDDLQWADTGSLDLLQQVIRGCAGSAILVALTIRDEEIVDAPHLDALLHALTRDGLLDRLPLRPLTREQVQRLARDLSGAGTAPARLERLATQAWRASEGNPLLAIEATRDALRPRRGASKHDDLPARAGHLVTARLGRVSPAGMRMVQAAAVIGREFEFAVIARAAGCKPGEAARLAEELVRRRVFRSIGTQLGFSHDLIRETVAARLPSGAAARLHGAVAMALSAAGDRQSPTLAKRLADHYGRAGNTDRAVEWLARYAEQSLRRYAADEAVLAIEQALNLDQGSATARRAARRLALLLQLATALVMLGRFGELSRRLLAEQAAADRLGDPGLAAEYYFRLAQTQAILEQPDHLDEIQRRGLEAAERTGDPGARGRMFYAIAAGCVTFGQPRDGIRRARRAVTLLHRAGDRQWLVLALWVLGLHRLTIGAFDAALAAERRSVAVAQSLDDRPGSVSFGAGAIAWIQLERGEFDAAQAQCQAVLAVPGEMANALAATGFIGLIHLERGETQQGIALLEPVVERIGSPTRRDLFLIPLGEAYVAAGTLERARAVATQADASAARSPSLWRRGRTGRLAALLAEAEGRRGDADTLLAAAFADLEQVPAPLELCRTHLAAARIASQRGDIAASEARRDLARAQYRALGAPLRAALLDPAMKIRTNRIAGR